MDPMQMFLQSLGESTQVAQSIRSAAQQQRQHEDEMRLRNTEQAFRQDQADQANRHQAFQEDQTAQQNTQKNQSEGLLDQLRARAAGGTPVSPQGTAQQLGDVPRFRMDESGAMSPAGAGVNVPVDQSQTVMANGQQFYMPSQGEQAETDLRGKVRQAAALNDVNSFSLPEALSNAWEERMGVPKGSLKGTQVPKTAVPGLIQQFAKPEPAEKEPRKETPDDWVRIATDPASTTAEKSRANAALRLHQQTRPAPANITIPGLGGNQTPEQQKLTGDDFLKTLPAGTAAQVKALAEGRQTQLPRGKELPALMNAVNQYDPSYTVQRGRIRGSFTTGPEAQHIGAVNTAIVHLGRLGDTAEALQNGSFTPGNELFNYFKDKFGSSVTTNFGLLKDAVAGEMAKALKGNATDVEIEKMGKSIRASNSPAQMHGVVSEGMSILKDKANTYDERYHNVLPDDPWSPILPSAKAQLQKHAAPKAAAAGAGDGGQFAVKDPNGKVHSFPNQQAADNFKRAAGIQ